MPNTQTPIERFKSLRNLPTMPVQCEGGPKEVFAEFLTMARSLTIDKILALPPEEFDALADQAWASDAYCDWCEEPGDDEYCNDPHRYVHPHD